MRTVYILWLRELKKYFRSRSRMIGSLGQPLLFLLTFGFGRIYSQAGEGNYIQFLAPGIISMTILFTGNFSGISLIWDKQFGFLKETLVAPVPRLSIMLGKTLGGATVALLQGTIVFVMTLFIGFRPISLSGLPLAFFFAFMIALFFTSLGIAIASTLEDMQGFQLIMNFLVMPIFFLSGALFPPADLLAVLGIVTKLNPLSYGVDGLRSVLIGISSYSTFMDFSIMLLLSLLILFIGSSLFGKIKS